MDFQNAYEWGKLFAAPWDELVDGMSARASTMGLAQEVKDESILWLSGNQIRAKFCFLPDPSDIEAVRRIFSDEENIAAPVCFIVVKQPDASEERGDVIFDIFRMSPESYLWHFHRVYTPPK